MRLLPAQFVLGAGHSGSGAGGAFFPLPLPFVHGGGPSQISDHTAAHSSVLLLHLYLSTMLVLLSSLSRHCDCGLATLCYANLHGFEPRSTQNACSRHNQAHIMQGCPSLLKVERHWGSGEWANTSPRAIKGICKGKLKRLLASRSEDPGAWGSTSKARASAKARWRRTHARPQWSRARGPSCAPLHEPMAVHQG